MSRPFVKKSVNWKNKIFVLDNIILMWYNNHRKDHGSVAIRFTKKKSPQNGTLWGFFVNIKALQIPIKASAKFSLSKKYRIYTDWRKKGFYSLITKRKTAIHIPSALNVRRFAPHVYLPRIVVTNIKNKRNSHFIGLQTDLSRSVLLFECELRFLTYRYFAIAAIFGAARLRRFASAEATRDAVPLTPATL